MRSRIVTGSVFLVLVLAMVSTCRQKPDAATAPGLAESPETATPTAAQAPDPNVPVAARNAAAQTNGASRAAAANRDGSPTLQTATITADDAEAQVNVRSQPSPEAEAIGYARVGDSVVLGRSEADADGYTWYYVTFPQGSTVGWVRSDLLDIAAPASAAEAVADTTPANVVNQPPSDVLKRSLDKTCGGLKAIESYFVTPSNTIYVCKARGQRTYLSQETGTEQVVTAPEVEAVGRGYIISNGNFEYRLDSTSLVVVRFDHSGKQEEVLRENVIYTERY